MYRELIFRAIIGASFGVGPHWDGAVHGMDSTQNEIPWLDMHATPEGGRVTEKGFLELHGQIRYFVEGLHSPEDHESFRVNLQKQLRPVAGSERIGLGSLARIMFESAWFHRVDPRTGVLAPFVDKKAWVEDDAFGRIPSCLQTAELFRQHAAHPMVLPPFLLFHAVQDILFAALPGFTISVEEKTHLGPGTRAGIAATCLLESRPGVREPIWGAEAEVIFCDIYDMCDVALREVATVMSAGKFADGSSAPALSCNLRCRSVLDETLCSVQTVSKVRRVIRCRRFVSSAAFVPWVVE